MFLWHRQAISLHKVAYRLQAIAAILLYWIRIKVVQQLTCLTYAVRRPNGPAGPLGRPIWPVSCLTRPSCQFNWIESFLSTLVITDVGMLIKCRVFAELFTDVLHCQCCDCCRYCVVNDAWWIKLISCMSTDYSVRAPVWPMKYEGIKWISL